jgi:AcrR family transcriptional regulator
MDELAQRLINEAIALGGSNEANREFSTKDIATAALVSEPTLFSRFPTKDDLVDAASSECMRRFTEYACTLVDAKVSLKEFISKMIDHQLEKKEESVYLLNYAHAVDHGPNPDEYAINFRKMITYSAEKVLRSYTFNSDEERFIAYSALARAIIYCVVYILDGVWPNNEVSRENTYHIVAGGINGYMKEKVAL